MQKKQLTERQRFETHFTTSKNCWNWHGASFLDGYGRFLFGKYKKQTVAHRASWEIFVGKIPEGKLVCHRCDNRKCVRPSHLFIGTQRDNMRDMMAKGRGNKSFGENCGNAKLKATEVVSIRKEYGKLNQRELSEQYGVHQSTISRVIGLKMRVI